MKPLRNLTTLLASAAIVALAIFGSGCDYIHKVIAKDKLNQGAILYNQGRAKQAQAFFREATETDPSNAIAWLYLGATLVRDYKDQTGDAQKQTANDALKVYEKALSLAGDNCATKDNAVLYIANIYDDLKNDEQWRNWFLRRAEDKCATREVKATTYYAIAVKFWRCSFDQTSRYEDKTKSASQPFHYRNMDYPAALPDKQKSETCASEGLKYIEKALETDPEYIDAMYYKALLYRELQKLSKDQAKHKEMERMALKIVDAADTLRKTRQAQPQPQGSPQANNGRQG